MATTLRRADQRSMLVLLRTAGYIWILVSERTAHIGAPRRRIDVALHAVVLQAEP